MSARDIRAQTQSDRKDRMYNKCQAYYDTIAKMRDLAQAAISKYIGAPEPRTFDDLLNEADTTNNRHNDIWLEFDNQTILEQYDGFDTPVVRSLNLLHSEEKNVRELLNEFGPLDGPTVNDVDEAMYSFVYYGVNYLLQSTRDGYVSGRVVSKLRRNLDGVKDLINTTPGFTFDNLSDLTKAKCIDLENRIRESLHHYMTFLRREDEVREYERRLSRRRQYYKDTRTTWL